LLAEPADRRGYPAKRQRPDAGEGDDGGDHGGEGALENTLQESPGRGQRGLQGPKTGDHVV